MGNFDQNIDVEIYDVYEEEENQKICLSCFDKNDKLFLFYGMSSNRKDWLLITEITNEQVKKYDISLAKKFNLDSNNINFTITNKEYGFKFGRLISDDNIFYSLFLGNDVGYQVQGDFNSNLSLLLLNSLNKMEKVPSLQDYIVLFEKIILDNDIEFTNIKISAYKDFSQVCSFELADKYKENAHQKALNLKK